MKEDRTLLWVLVGLAAFYFLVLRRQVTGGGLVYSNASGLFGRTTTITTPFGSARTGPLGTSIVIPQSVLDSLGGGGASGGGSGASGFLAVPAPTQDPTSTFTMDGLPISDPSTEPGLLPVGAQPVTQDPTLDPSGGSDPFTLAAFDPSVSGDLVGALS